MITRLESLYDGTVTLPVAPRIPVPNAMIAPGAHR